MTGDQKYYPEPCGNKSTVGEVTAYQCGYDAGRQSAIEACAKMVEERAERYKNHVGDVGLEARVCALAIRAIGKKG